MPYQRAAAAVRNGTAAREIAVCAHWRAVVLRSARGEGHFGVLARAGQSARRAVATADYQYAAARHWAKHRQNVVGAGRATGQTDVGDFNFASHGMCAVAGSK